MDARTPSSQPSLWSDWFADMSPAYRMLTSESGSTQAGCGRREAVGKQGQSSHAALQANARSATDHHHNEHIEQKLESIQAQEHESRAKVSCLVSSPCNPGPQDTETHIYGQNDIELHA